MADHRTLPAGPAVAGGWTAEQAADLAELRRQRDAAPAGSPERLRLEAILWRQPTPDSSGFRYAEGL
jgi:hypothetical protein